MRQGGLCITDVWKAYGRRAVLRGASLNVRGGTLTGVVGENGAGKTTLLRIICGQLQPDSGRVHCSSRLGYCPQQAVLDDSLTVGQHLRFFQVAYRLSDLRLADELLELLGCTEYRNERTGALSGGTRQKLNLVIAMMHDPPVLVLDEPYQGFDWQTYLRFWDLTQRLRERGTSLLVVSHLAHDADRFDEICELRDGRIASLGRRTPAPAHEGSGL
ncbi:ABC transporter ATP-binding protein [Streptomyces lavendulae subsp. grasserius]